MTSSAPSRRQRLRAGATAALAALTVTTTLVAPATTARADDANITCTPTQNVFTVQDDGQLLLYSFNDLSSASTPILAAPTKAIGGGWQQFTRVLAGPDGWLYGISSKGTFAYHWNGSTFDVVAKPLGGIFNGYATASRAQRITIDARGDFWLITDDGILRRYDLDEKTTTFSQQPMGFGWNIFSSVAAAGDGVLYARTPAGALRRYQFEKTSDRYLHTVLIGPSGWDRFPGSMFSVGGDVFLGVESSGKLIQYRYKRDPNASFPVVNRTVGTGWQQFLHVAGTTNNCRLTASYVPAAPTVPTRTNAPLAVLPTDGGGLEYGYSDNIGRTFWGHQPDSTDFGSVAWTPIHGAEAFTGTPGLVQRSDARIEFTLHNLDSRFAARVQKSTGATELGEPVDRGGVMASEAVTTRVTGNNRVVTFAVDGDGGLWTRYQHTDGNYLPWTRVSSPVLSGDLTIAPGADNVATLIARDVNGTFWAAPFGGVNVGSFTSLGGSGFTGRAAVVRYPGDLLRVFARDGAGRIRTQKQTTAGSTFPGEWTTVGSAEDTWPGSPTAVLAPDTGLVEVLVRGEDGRNHFAQEQGQGSGNWPVWKPVGTDSQERYTTDPTAFTYRDSGVQRWAFATYTQDFQVRVFTAGSVGAPARSGGRAAVVDPVFTRHQLPAAER